MNTKKILTGILLSAALQAGIFAQTRILLIGDSYTEYNDLPGKIEEIANSKGEDVEVVSRTPGGKSLEYHSQNDITLRKIREGNWDYVVLQEQSVRPASSEQLFKDGVYYYAGLLKDEIHKASPNAKTLFYMTWGRNNSGDCGQNSGWSAPCSYTEMDDLIQSRYMTLAEGFNTTVAPVGKVKRYFAENSILKNYKWDIDSYGHPGNLATYAAACTFYTILFEKDPTLINRRFGIASDTASNIRAAVKKVVFENLSDYSFPKRDTRMVTEITTGTKVTVFPNPFSDVLNIQTEDRLHAVKLTSIGTSQQVADFNGLDGYSFQLNTSSAAIPPGFYSLHVQTDRNVSDILVEKK